MITNTGMANQATALAAAFGFLGIGDGSVAESAAHTDLQGTNKKRKAVTGTTVTVAQAGDTAQWQSTFSAASDGLSSTWNVQEAGVFTAVSAGVMAFRKIFAAKSCNWDAGDTLQVTATLQVKQGTA